ncbi:MAG TPA: hypothetical protein VFV93_01990 [Thermomicrobiales bacterium]|nr:hypothetical protein [Thermomicrobiales bacterium]
MMNPTDLDVRFLNHTANVSYADRFGSLYPATQPQQHSPRRYVASVLLRLSARLAPQQTQQAIARDSAGV